MNAFVQNAVDIATTTRTENLDKTYSSSLDRNVDLFFQIGAIRGQKPERIRGLFSAAYGEDSDLAMKIVLWARDIRQGAGERQTFREVLKYLNQHDFDRLKRIVHLVPVLGRWDDLFVLCDNPRGKELALGLYAEGLRQGNGLAAKWAPREVRTTRTNKHEKVVKRTAARLEKNSIARDLADHLGFTPKQYRKYIAEMTKVVESQMCAKNWDLIDYGKVPSVASARYAKAFGRHDQERYAKYLESVKKGEAKINTGAVYPYDVIKAVNQGGDAEVAADVMWNNLPDFVPDGMSFMPVVDVSGSMSSSCGGNVKCIDVSVSLGMYLAERNKSAYNRLMLTFNTNPWFFTIPKGTLKEKVRAVMNSDRAMHGSTDLDKAMQLILSIAINHKVPQSDMPSHLLILSDMEFNAALSIYGDGTKTVAQRTIELFEYAGYKVPNIVWWNIQSRHGNTPVRAGDKGMALVSGFSPSIMKSLLKGEMDPRLQMIATVDIERYKH